MYTTTLDIVWCSEVEYHISLNITTDCKLGKT